MTEFKGYTDGHEFRATNRYTDTQKLFEMLGLSDEVENRTPTVGVNVAHLARMPSIQALSNEVTGRSLQVVVLGISTAQGPRDLQTLLKGLGANHVSTIAVDISDGIFDDIKTTGLDEVVCLQKDARDTGLPDGSVDLVLRDHLGNCCPPQINASIEWEVARIVKPGGLSIVNITSSDMLLQSQDRRIIPFAQLRELVNNDLELIWRLQSSIYDLEDLKKHDGIPVDQICGSIIEIEPDMHWHVVFGEDAQGHGEWFESFQSHINNWETAGFQVTEHASRIGLDSHVPQLKCVRHNVLMRKISSIRRLGHEVYG